MESILSKLKANIRSVLISTPNTLTIGQFKSDYKKMIGHRLPYEEYGFGNLKLFLESLPDVVQLMEYNNNTIVKAVNVAESAHVGQLVQKNKKKRRSNREMYKSSSSEESDCNVNTTINEEEEWNPPIKEPIIENKILDYYVPSLPSIISEIFPNDLSCGLGRSCRLETDLDESFELIGYPDKVIRHTNEIKRVENLMSLKKSTFFPIMVTGLYSPYKFWFNLYDGELKQLMIDLNAHYKKMGKKELQMDSTHFQQHAVCVAKFQGLWHRATIIDGLIDADGLLKVYFIDHGIVFRANPNYVKYLVQPFDKFKRQALRGRLAFIRPVDSKWSSQAVEKFSKLTINIVLFAKCHYYDKETQTHYLELLNTHNEADENIVDQMIACELAMESSLEGTNRVPVRYPTFNMLEKGIVPESLLLN